VKENDRILDEYRKHRILAAYKDGKLHGRTWKNKDLIFDEVLELDDVISAIALLKQNIDDSFSERRKKRGKASPKAQEYIDAFRANLGDIHEGQLKMLQAHYKAPNRMLTATQLADAAGYKKFNSANLQYGLLGEMLNEELCMELPQHENGAAIQTFVLATGTEEATSIDEQWLWIMRPEVAEAIEHLGLLD